MNIIITDVQEYLGSYVVDEKGVFVFQEGVLPMAMRNGFWIILDELNLGKHYKLWSREKVYYIFIEKKIFSILFYYLARQDPSLYHTVGSNGKNPPKIRF